MGFSNENVFKVEYTSVLGECSFKKQKRTTRILKFIHKHKVISMVMAIFTICVIINIILIFNFIKVLQLL